MTKFYELFEKQAQNVSAPTTKTPAKFGTPGSVTTLDGKAMEYMDNLRKDFESIMDPKKTRATNDIISNASKRMDPSPSKDYYKSIDAVIPKQYFVNPSTKDYVNNAVSKADSVYNANTWK